METINHIDTMGFFSFILQDTGEAIPNHHLREAKEFGDFHIHGPNGVCFSSNGYDGYGDFYGEVGDIFFFTYSLNRKRKINPCDDLGWEKARAIGHRIFHYYHFARQGGGCEQG